jgi:hypothetical protein
MKLVPPTHITREALYNALTDQSNLSFAAVVKAILTPIPQFNVGARMTHS